MGNVAAVGAGSSRILLILAVCALANACGPPPPPPPPQPTLDYSGGHGDVKVVADDGTGPKPDQASGVANGGAGNTVSKKVIQGATNAEGKISTWESIDANFALSRNAAATHSPKASSDNIGTTDAALKGNQDRTFAGDLTTKITANVHNARTAQVVVTLKVETSTGGGVGTAATQTYSLSENAADNTKLDIKDKTGAVIMTVKQGAATDMPAVPFSFTLTHATPGPAKFKFTYTLSASGEAEVASDLKAEGRVAVK